MCSLAVERHTDSKEHRFVNARAQRLETAGENRRLSCALGFVRGALFLGGGLRARSVNMNACEQDESNCDAWLSYPDYKRLKLEAQLPCFIQCKSL